jgi:hypothetical protein
LPVCGLIRAGDHRFDPSRFFIGISDSVSLASDKGQLTLIFHSAMEESDGHLNRSGSGMAIDILPIIQ